MDFKLNVPDSDHSVAQLSLQKELIKNCTAKGAHRSNGTGEPGSGDLLSCVGLFLFENCKAPNLFTTT